MASRTVLPLLLAVMLLAPASVWSQEEEKLAEQKQEEQKPVEQKPPQMKSQCQEFEELHQKVFNPKNKKLTYVKPHPAGRNCCQDQWTNYLARNQHEGQPQRLREKI